ncbi:hypothetical protein CKAH01_16382 [Colletotrichum kahawae]|uniref:Uncharacterized protein n=1 Tax=Colletotrichum kahawae TaxID=34407 RepID=A0AAE0D6V9_COLKA|nr:hypothetical protein CKAH01_16382 [Colletotrichum kahawae]
MAPQLVDDAICFFNRFSEATSPGILRELIENADWKESLQRFCDSDPSCAVKIAWSMIDMCSSNSHVNEFKNPDLHPFVRRKRNSFAPFIRRGTGPSEGPGTYTARTIQEPNLQAVADLADANNLKTIEQGRSEPARPASFASTSLTSQRTSPSPPATNPQIRHISLCPTDRHCNMILNSDRYLDTSLCAEENPPREWTSIRRTDDSLSLSQPVCSSVKTPTQRIIHETHSFHALVAACQLESAQMKAQDTSTGMTSDRPALTSTPSTFEAAPSSSLGVPSYVSFIQKPAVEAFRPAQPSQEDDLVSRGNITKPVLPCAQGYTSPSSSAPEYTSPGAMQVLSASKVDEIQSSPATSYGPSPAPSENFTTPESEFNEPEDLHRSRTAAESLTVFIDDAVDIIRALSQDHPEGQNEDFRTLARDLKTNSIDIDWTNGEAWLRVIEKGNDNRRRLNTNHMIMFAAFARWYDSQVAKLQGREPELKKKTASNIVMNELMAHKTSPATSNEISSISRSSLRTQLAKGRKLLCLTRRFGYGVMLAGGTW